MGLVASGGKLGSVRGLGFRPRRRAASPARYSARERVRAPHLEPSDESPPCRIRRRTNATGSSSPNPTSTASRNSSTIARRPGKACATTGAQPAARRSADGGWRALLSQQREAARHRRHRAGRARRDTPDDSAWNPRSDYFDADSDRTAPTWFRVDVAFVARFSPALSRETLLAEPSLAKMMLLQKGSRLSIQPVTDAEWRAVLRLARCRVTW